MIDSLGQIATGAVGGVLVSLMAAGFAGRKQVVRTDLAIRAVFDQLEDDVEDTNSRGAEELAASRNDMNARQIADSGIARAEERRIRAGVATANRRSCRRAELTRDTLIAAEGWGAYIWRWHRGVPPMPACGTFRVPSESIGAE